MERPEAFITLRLALREAAARLALAENGRSDAELLLLHLLAVDRAYLLTHSGDLLDAEQLDRYRQLIERRKGGEPIQYITGEREFYGLRFSVTSDVLIPRPETEHLVEAALERIPADTSVQIADVGTGSGAIAVTLAVARPAATLAALDISLAALKVAAKNASAHQVADQIRFLESDLLAEVKDEKFDMVVSNPPYIADGERHSLAIEVKEHEPAQALFAGPTGLEIYEQLIPQAAHVLRPGGWMLLEVGAGQHLQLKHLLLGWKEVSFIADLQGILRIAVAQLP